MGRGIGWVCGAALTLGITAACTGGDPAGAPTGSSTSPALSSPDPVSSAGPSPAPPVPTSPRASTVRPVPVDQIPPGNPSRWVPAGVPTTARYREPGDVVPMFTQAMFKNNQAGALSMANYYIDAQNWAVAINDFQSARIVCDARRCELLDAYFKSLRDAGKHLQGDRSTQSDLHVIPGPAVKEAQWVVRVRIVRSPSREIGRTGVAGKTYPKQVIPTNLYMKWNGHVWRVADDAID